MQDTCDRNITFKSNSYSNSDVWLLQHIGSDVMGKIISESKSNERNERMNERNEEVK